MEITNFLLVRKVTVFPSNFLINCSKWFSCLYVFMLSTCSVVFSCPCIFPNIFNCYQFSKIISLSKVSWKGCCHLSTHLNHLNHFNHFNHWESLQRARSMDEGIVGTHSKDTNRCRWDISCRDAEDSCPKIHYNSILNVIRGFVFSVLCCSLCLRMFLACLAK